MGKFNMLVKSSNEKEYIIVDMIATKLSKGDFETLKKLNSGLLGEYRFIAYGETDFSWWQHCNKYLTKTRLYKQQCFDIDFNGNIERF